MFKLLKKAKPYTKLIVGVVVLLFAAAMFDLLLPTLMSKIVNEGIESGDTHFIIVVGIQMLGVSLASVICSICSNYLSSKASMSLGRDLRSETFRKITYYSMHEVDKFGTASLITRTTNDVRQMQMVLQMGLRQIVSMPLHLIGGIVMAASMDVTLATIIVVAMPLLLIIIALNINWVRPLFRIMMDKLDRVNLVLREILSGVRVIRAFDRLDYEHDRFNNTNKDYTDTNRKARHRMALMHPLTMMVMNGATVAILWFGQYRINVGAMTTGDLMAFSQYVMQILGSVMGIRMIFNMIPRAMVSAGRINEILDTNSDIVDPIVPKTPAKNVRGYVKFENVTFKYPGAEEAVLSNISFETRPGETTAIIGGTGSGKSTLITLIPRLYDIQEGKISVDGVSISEMTQKDLRSRIGFIPQKALLFTGTIADNIRYGKMDASDEEVRAAADIAQATEFIDAMAEGFDSFLSQDATNVSGGQKQRISIARALIKKPEIYIFDDSFSALDFKTDAMLRAALKPVTKDATVIIVAQRVSTVMNADRIIVLDDGKCVGLGTHKELLNTCEVYREIVSSQLKEEEIA